MRLVFACDLRAVRDLQVAAAGRGYGMNSQIKGLRVASIIFGVLALAQFLRLVIRPDMFVYGHPVPLWPSALAFVILAGLSLWMWKLTRMPTKGTST